MLYAFDSSRNCVVFAYPNICKRTIVSSPFRKFQSTPSAWRETLLLPFFLFSRSHFNPLPPHGGRQSLAINNLCPRNFNPLPPHGGRRSDLFGDDLEKEFQSTPSAWRETIQKIDTTSNRSNFNPLPPHGGRPSCTCCRATILHFNPLPPHGGRPAFPLSYHPI